MERNPFDKIWVRSKNRGGDKMMFKIKMMTNRQEGYRTLNYVYSEEEAREWIRAYKIYHNPIDIYYSRIY